MRRNHLGQIVAVIIGWAVAASVSCAQTAPGHEKWASLDPKDVQVDNHVERCLDLKLNETVVHGQIVKLVAEATFLQSTAACGCKSALLSYSASVRRTAEYAEVLVTAVISSGSQQENSKRRFEFVVASDASIPFDKAVKLDLGCATDE